MKTRYLQAYTLLFLGMGGVMDAILHTTGNAGGVEAVLGGVVTAFGIYHLVMVNEP